MTHATRCADLFVSPAPARRPGPAPRLLVALAGLAWSSCALAQDLPASGPMSPPSIQANENDDPGGLRPNDRARDLLEARRNAGRDVDRDSAPQYGAASRVRPGGGGITNDGLFSIDIEGPMDLSAFVELVSEALQINIIEDAGLQGRTILFRAPLAIPMDDVIPFLRSLLEDNGFTIVSTDMGFYRIRQDTTVDPSFQGGALATTKIIPTPLVKPSSLQSLITTQFSATNFRLNPIDELGVLLVTGSPSSLDNLEEFVSRVISEVGNQRLFPFQLTNVSADYARSRILQLNGQLATGTTATPQAAQGLVSALSNLDSRLILDQGNTLLFKGTPDEAQGVASLVSVVDVVTPLIVKRYVAGSVAREAARAGERLGLGPVTELDQGSSSFNPRAGANVQPGGVNVVQPAVSGFTVDPETGSVIYYGTLEQHRTVDELIEQFKETAIGENIEIKTYKLLYAKAEGDDNVAGVAEILEELIAEPSRQRADSPFLPQTGNVTPGPAADRLAQALDEAGVVGEDGGTRLLATTENTIIVSDPGRNQIIIKAPAAAQEQFAKIIAELDQKQPQVLIQVKIVSVILNDTFDWSADVQFNFGQFSWFSGFGVTGAPADGDPFSARTFPVPESGNGLTTGLIKSDYLPFAIQTLQTKGETRVISEPQILVNDNQTASLESLAEIPYASASQGTSTTITSQGGTAEAGTVLEVTPRISEGGDITLEYSVELSDFTGVAQGGLQPPAQRDIYGSFVTLPTDTTVVVGGFRLDRDDTQENKVPILGDIPVLGNLFKSYSKDTRDSVIFVFITPVIMHDPSGADLRLITAGPMAEVGIDPDVPMLQPAIMPIVGSLGVDERLIPTNTGAEAASTSDVFPVASTRD